MISNLRWASVVAIIMAVAGVNKSHAQIRYDWVGPVGVEANYKQGDTGLGESVNWLNVGPPPANLQPDRAFDEYGSISNGGIALIDSPVVVSPSDVRIAEEAGATGSLVIRNGGSMTIQEGVSGGGDGRLANGINGAGVLVLRDNMGPVSVQNYSQNATSTLVAQLSGGSTFTNRIAASTQISVDGTLRVERVPGSSFVAAAGNSWTLISGAPVVGSFDNVVVDPALRGNSGQVFGVSTASNAVNVSVEQRLVAQVDRFTGNVQLVNPSGHAVSIPTINYTLSSPTNGVSGVAGRWNSLADQGVSGWFEANPTATQLSELNPLGQLTFTPGQSRDLGTPINVNAAAPLGTNRVNVGDVTLQYQLPTGGYLSGVVEPVGRYNDVVLVVNPTTGATIIQNQATQSINFISYTIASASGSLEPTFSGLSGAGMPNWFKANPTTTNLSELSTIGTVAMDVGGELALGMAWDVAGEQDLTFRYQTPDGFLHNGTVHFGAKTVIATENADFDGDADVDGNDFLVWQRGVGLTGQPNGATGDANGDGNVNGSDLSIWRAQFGTSPANIAAAAVPEPASGLLALAMLALINVYRRA